LLLNEGANVNDQSIDGYTPLMFAAVNKNKEYIKNLIKYNANLYIRNNDNQTVFDIDEIDDDIKKYIRSEKYSL
jgi:ankyrin repeat protein